MDIEKSPEYLSASLDIVYINVLDRYLYEDKLKSALEASNGKAIIIVHPFSPESWLEAGHPRLPNTEEKEKISQYYERLKTTISKYQELQLPIILFEEFSKSSVEQKILVKEILTELGVNTGVAFVVLTQLFSPRPTDTHLINRAKDFFKFGMKRAVVMGSYLWEKTDTEEGGCVRAVVDALEKSGIRTRASFATYPRRNKSEVGMAD